MPPYCHSHFHQELSSANMFQCASFILALSVLSCCGRADGVNPNPESVTRRGIPAAPTRPTRVDKIRDVEAVDPGLLSPVPNTTVNTRSTSTLGKQFNTPPGSFGNSFGTNAFGNNLGPENGFPFVGQPGVGQAGAFIPQAGQAGGFQTGAFPTNGVFPGGGILPGVPLPPGSVSADTVAFSASRASDYTRVGVTQVRFDFTLTDIGYGWYPDRSEFVCYYPGLYFFSFSGLSTQTRQAKLSLIRNNQEIVSAWGDTNGYQTASNSAILTLNQGDRVYLVLQEGNLHETNNNGGRGGYTTFSGFRIR